MLSQALANIVWCLHILFIVWMVVVPFTNNEPMLVLHAVVVPFLWLHWAMSEDTCALTVAERWLRGVEKSESFFHNLMSPIYVIQDDDVRKWSWVASIVLWLVTMSKVMKKPHIFKDVLLPWTRTKDGAAPDIQAKPVADQV